MTFPISHRSEYLLTEQAVLFGAVPVSSAGGGWDRGGVGYALESQTKPMYDGTASRGTVVHELAHQWFGDSVTPEVWPDIWLNEGLARFEEWFYRERAGGQLTPASVETASTTPAPRHV